MECVLYGLSHAKWSFFTLRMRKGLLDAPHHITLLDGEMVVDEDIVTVQRKRRYLAYDLMLLNGKSIIDLPFKVNQCNMYLLGSLP